MSRLNIRKTYKLYINGEFPRTESGRFYPVHSSKGDTLLANACRGSRKDLRNAVAAARKAFPGWSGKTAYNRGQILYRIAEVCESRAAEMEEELRRAGATKNAARKEVEQTIDRWVYYAGWADKFSQILGTVNPVSGPYFNFTLTEPTGVVGIISPETPSLLGLVSRLAPAVVSGNTVVALTSETQPLAAITMGEIFETSDVPAGVINLISGFKKELVSWLAAHMDVNSIDLAGVPDAEMRLAATGSASENVKRVVGEELIAIDWATDRRAESIQAIADFL
ncbi:MAG TPA: aldehyde dehydrogenase family protein, partial [Thermoanaerobaculia bacterium]|nr:aldehyde dehydrogenase family protein [Thermoanaerobaculia bacterium]